MTNRMDAHADPMLTTAIDGEVVVLGPGRISEALTPDAAEESGRRLISAAEVARGQLHRRNDPIR